MFHLLLYLFLWYLIFAFEIKLKKKNIKQNFVVIKLALFMQCCCTIIYSASNLFRLVQTAQHCILFPRTSPDYKIIFKTQLSSYLSRKLAEKTKTFISRILSYFFLSLFKSSDYWSTTQARIGLILCSKYRLIVSHSFPRSHRPMAF